MRKGLAILCLSLLACQQSNNQPLESTGMITDITEDFHHRMKAGALDLRKEPVVVSVVKNTRAGLVDIPDAYVRVYWELGSFWVKSNDNCLVVMHWNQDVAYGHVKVVASTQGDATRRHFRHDPVHPLIIER